MKSIISRKCLSVRNVNAFNVGIKRACHFFIFNLTGSVNSSEWLSPLESKTVLNRLRIGCPGSCAHSWSNQLGVGWGHHVIPKTLPPGYVDQPGTFSFRKRSGCDRLATELKLGNLRVRLTRWKSKQNPDFKREIPKVLGGLAPSSASTLGSYR